MRRNLGAEDRLFRLILGLSILPLSFVLSGHAALLGWLGFIPLATALFGWSPLYAVFGIRSCQVEADANLQAQALPAA